MSNLRTLDSTATISTPLLADSTYPQLSILYHIMHSVEISHPNTADAESEGRKSWGSQDRIIKAQTDFEIRREGGRDPYEIP